MVLRRVSFFDSFTAWVIRVYSANSKLCAVRPHNATREKLRFFFVAQLGKGDTPIASPACRLRRQRKPCRFPHLPARARPHGFAQ
jgi:hypothetical protein